LRRSGRLKLYRGNLNLVQKINKTAAQQKMKGAKGKGVTITAPNKQPKKTRMRCCTCFQWLGGTSCMNDVIVKDEKAKVAVRALNREYGTGRGSALMRWHSRCAPCLLQSHKITSRG
jgi:hypothetical protein